MKEKATKNASAAVPAPSGESSATTAQGRGKGGRKPTGKIVKKVKFSPLLPQWKARHSLRGVGVRGKKEKGRVPLGSLQPHASTPRLLVGAGSPRPATIGKPAAAKKDYKVESKTSSSSSESVAEMGVQTDGDGRQSTSLDYRMCTDEVPPVEYWQVLAERRREALAETLKENEELYAEIETLKRKVEDLEAQVNCGQYFSFMYKLATAADDDSVPNTST